MSSLIDKLRIQEVLDISESLISRLPGLLQRVLRSPVAQKGFIAWIVWRVLKSASNRYSQLKVNNFTLQKPWDPTRELVVLTGGSSGIGYCIAQDLVAIGLRVAILDIQEPLRGLPTNAYFYRVDLTSSADVKKAAGLIRKDHGQPTILVNNAGVGHGGTLLKDPEENITQTFEVNTISHFWTVKEFLPNMILENHGHIVTVASMASFAAMAGAVDYCCSKAAALAFHEGLAQEIRHYYKAPRVRTSIIHSFWVQTPMVQELVNKGALVGKKILKPEHVSRAVVKQIRSQCSGQVVVPSTLSRASALRSYPAWLQEFFRDRTSKEFVAFGSNPDFVSLRESVSNSH
ncbi:hypothetical protein Z517_02871 [Fonsecaea pedrosoi CBS 271.37]|uniref:Short-chain dehydrogenase/reductase 3 n=1 Tax=Fonsecaea pedrosoi CBS 271.37 TaxID=1442368 RepID=A0A0D2GYC0_9EURO|nr:uncharacterized protein Z517_02871 [Fonsecaea pedrosoi CBS 271.37]KIW83625.1 hypothetical protein Z517_02871 [Fonsecaea pedrosoi CBS 271.37]